MGTVINTGPQNVAGYSFNSAYAPSTAEMSGGSTAGYGTIASGVISGLSEIATGFINAQRVKNTYKFNAAMAQLQGRMMRLSADVEIKNIRKKANTLFSYQRAAYAKMGVKTMEGSPAAVMMDSLKEAELDAIYADISATYNVGLLQTQSQINKMYAQSAGYDALQGSFKSILNTGVKVWERYELENKNK